MIKNCLRCNTEFYTKPARVKVGKGKYCSVKCYKGEKIDKACGWCGKKFQVTPCLIRIKTCSISCGKRLQLKDSKNHWNWKGGKGTERHRLMGKKEYILWRTAIFIRDNYTCQECNKKGVYLEADHIKPWVLYPELRYAIDNGRTLCRECHRQTDTWGRRVFLRA